MSYFVTADYKRPGPDWRIAVAAAVATFIMLVWAGR